MKYAYRSEGGQTLSRDYPIGEAPESVRVKGVTYYFQFGTKFAMKGSRGTSSNGGWIKQFQIPYKGSDAAVDEAVRKAGGQWAKDGTAMMPSPESAKEMCKRTENEYGSYVWDD